MWVVNVKLVTGESPRLHRSMADRTFFNCARGAWQFLRSHPLGWPKTFQKMVDTIWHSVRSRQGTKRLADGRLTTVRWGACSVATIDERVISLEDQMAEQHQLMAEMRDTLRGLDGRVGQLDVRVEQMDLRIGQRLDGVDARMDRFETRMDRFEDRVERRFDTIDQRFIALDTKLSRQFTWLVGLIVTVLITGLATR